MNDLGQTREIVAADVSASALATRFWVWRHKRHGKPFVHEFADGWSWYCCSGPCNQWRHRTP